MELVRGRQTCQGRQKLLRCQCARSHMSSWAAAWVPSPHRPGGHRPVALLSEVEVTIDSLGSIVIDLRDRRALNKNRTILNVGDGLMGAGRTILGIKRTIDIIGATLMMLLFAPLAAIVALGVKLSSPGPVFFIQNHIGRNGEAIRFLKFRTMRSGADEELAALATANEADGPIFKIREDPRITSIGRLLRKLSIDELPQLVHVLAGQMSLVGPRPPLASEVEHYGEWESQRMMVKPGLTCIWQVSGRSDLDFDTWVEMDIEYIKTWSLINDLRLLALTVPAVALGRGAY